MKSIGIVGSRSRDTEGDYICVRTAFDVLYVPGDTIVSGGCPRGGDRFAERIAQELDVRIKIFPADWATLGKRAGFERNTDIAIWADCLIACVSWDRKGGTEDTITKFKRYHPKAVLVIV